MAINPVDQDQTNAVQTLYNLPLAPGHNENCVSPEQRSVARVGAYIVYTSGVKEGPYTQIYEVKGVLKVPEAPQDPEAYDIKPTKVRAIEILHHQDNLSTALPSFIRLAETLRIKIRHTNKFYFMVHLTPFEELEPLRSLTFRG